MQLLPLAASPRAAPLQQAEKHRWGVAAAAAKTAAALPPAPLCRRRLRDSSAPRASSRERLRFARLKRCSARALPIPPPAPCEAPKKNQHSSSCSSAFSALARDPALDEVEGRDSCQRRRERLKPAGRMRVPNLSYILSVFPPAPLSFFLAREGTVQQSFGGGSVGRTSF